MDENIIIGKTGSYRRLIEFAIGIGIDPDMVLFEINQELKKNYPGVAWNWRTREIEMEEGFNIPIIDLITTGKNVERFLKIAIPRIIGEQMILSGEENPLPSTVIVPLKFHRLKKGLTLKKLSEISSVNIRQIQKIESGNINILNITLKNAMALASALEISVQDLTMLSFHEEQIVSEHFIKLKTGGDTDGEN